MKSSSTRSGKTDKPARATAKKFRSVDEYGAALPATTRKKLEELRTTIQETAPAAEEMISYNMPAFKLNGTGLIWYAAWKEHLSLYPGSAAMEAAIPQLAAYKGSKATFKFPLDQPLPLALIRRIIRFRIKENAATQQKAKK